MALPLDENGNQAQEIETHQNRASDCLVFCHEEPAEHEHQHDDYEREHLPTTCDPKRFMHLGRFEIVTVLLTLGHPHHSIGQARQYFVVIGKEGRIREGPGVELRLLEANLGQRKRQRHLFTDGCIRLWNTFDYTLTIR